VRSRALALLFLMHLLHRPAPLHAACPAGTAAGGAPLRVVTLNLLHGGLTSERWGSDSELDERLALVTDGLRALDADVVALQEASVGGDRGDVTERLARALGYHHVREGSTRHMFGISLLGRLATWVLNLDEGPAIVSRHPLAATRHWVLDACDGYYSRVLLCAEVCAPSGAIEVCSTHLDGSTCQANEVARRLRSGSRRSPLVLMGDLNSTENEAALRQLREQLALVDAFRVVNPDQPGFTDGQDVYAPNSTARGRIDYVLVGRAATGDVPVVESRVVFNVPSRDADGDPLWPSDHYGVLAEIGPFRR
jgi:endonuclease/exonuclease/phosphatase family metal-dependent hydrolase